MAFTFLDRVRQTTTDGAAVYTTFGAALSSYQDFNVVTNGDTFWVCIAHQFSNEWLTGRVTKTAGPTLTLNEVFAASNVAWVGAPGSVAFSSGLKDIFMTIPAPKYAELLANQYPPKPLTAIAGMKGGPNFLGATISNTAVSAGRLYMTRFGNSEHVTINELGIRVGTASGAGTRCRLGIYNAGTNGLPSTLVQDAGMVLTDSVNYASIAALAAIEAGKSYWLAALFEAAPSVGAFTNSVANAAPLGYDSSGAANMGRGGIYRPLAFGTLPADETSQLANYASGAVAIPIVMWDAA